MLLAGEFVLSESDIDRNASPPGGTNVTVNIRELHANDGKQVADEIHRELASKP